MLGFWGTFWVLVFLCVGLRGWTQRNARGKMWAKEFGGMLSKLAWFSILVGAFINLQIVWFFLAALKLPLKTRSCNENCREVAAAVAAATAFCTPVATIRQKTNTHNNKPV